MNGITSLYCTLNKPRPAGKLSLGQSCNTHTLAKCTSINTQSNYCPTTATPPAQLPHMGVTFNSAPVLLSHQCSTAILPRMEVTLSWTHVLVAVGENLCKQEEKLFCFFFFLFFCLLFFFFLCMHSHVSRKRPVVQLLSVRYDTSPRPD